MASDSATPAWVEHEVEVGPASLLVVGRLDRVAGVDSPLGVRLGGGQRRGRDRRRRGAPSVSLTRAQLGLTSTPPGIEEHGLNRHGFSLHLSGHDPTTRAPPRRRHRRASC